MTIGFPTIARRMTLTAQLCGASISAGVIVSTWGQGITWQILGLCLLASVGNTLFVVLSFYDSVVKENVRAAFNLVVHAAIGVVCSWTFASWLFLPFITSLASLPSAGKASHRIVAILIVHDAIALATGAHWTDVVAFTLMSTFFQVLIDAYLALATSLLRERDRTLAELKVAQQVAIGQEKLASIGQLAAGVAHEVNNPMCFITANVQDMLEELQRDPDLPAHLVEYRDSVLPDTVDGIKRVNSIVGDLRRFARGEPEQFIRFDLATEVAAAVRMSRTQLSDAQQVHEDVASIEVVGMPRQIGKVILNLLVNALESLGETGQVWVRSVVRADVVELSVRDDGVGMSPETVHNLFHPFFTTKAPGDGVGLGLAVIHGIVTAHSARITVDSELGRGSCFTLILPRQQPIALAA